MCHHSPSGTGAPAARQSPAMAGISTKKQRLPATRSRCACGKVLLFPNACRILVFTLALHPSAFSHSLGKFKPLTLLWKRKKEEGNQTQPWNSSVAIFIKKQRISSIRKTSFSVQKVPSARKAFSAGGNPASTSTHRAIPRATPGLAPCCHPIHRPR